jgi:GNAT superfamily N-acetyltransferase
MSSAPNEGAANVRFYRSGDEEGMLRVLQASFPRWPEIETRVAPIDHLRWKLASDAEPEQHNFIAEVEGQIVGAQLGITQRYTGNGRTFRSCLDVDTAVLPEYRGRGIYSSMFRFRAEMTTVIDVSLANTGRESLSQLNRGLGQRPVGNRLELMICDLPERAQAALPDGMSLVDVDGFDERIARFWSQAARPFDFIVMPSQDDLNWRYCDTRGGIGAVLQAEEDSEVVGFAALRVSRGKGYIGYLLALPERADVVRGLIAACLARLRAAGIAEVSCALPAHHPFRSLLIDQGFTRKGHTIPFTCGATRMDELDISFLHEPRVAVHLMLGDTDLV